MDDIAALDDLASALALPGAMDRLRSLRTDHAALWHNLAITAYAYGKHAEMRIALDEYRRVFNTSGPVVIRCAYLFNRIGEMASAFGTLAHMKRLGKLPFDPVLLCEGGTCNPAYLDLWRRHFDIHTSRESVRQAHGDIPRAYLAFLPGPDGAFRPTADAYALCHRADTKPLLELAPSKIERGRDALESLGLPRDAWFVCLHARSPVYLSHLDDSHNDQRNSDIRTFEQAALRIAEHGGWTVRIGARGTELLFGWPNTIDLPHAHPQADWLDVYAMGACRFFLGDSSGPNVTASTFGRPCIGVNLQLGHPSTWMGLHAPKLFRRGGKLLAISEAIEAGLLMRQKPLPEGIETVDNTAEDIAAAVEARLMGGCLVSSEAQERYRSAFPPEIQRVLGLASPAFLEKHEGVLR